MITLAEVLAFWELLTFLNHMNFSWILDISETSSSGSDKWSTGAERDEAKLSVLLAEQLLYNN